VRLSAKQLKTLMEALTVLYEPVSLSQIARHILTSVEIIFKGAVLTFDRFDLKSRCFEHLMVGAEPSNREQWLGRLPEVIHQNPVIFTASRGGGPVLRLSALISERQFMRTDFYHDIIKPLQTRDQIGCILSHSTGVLGLSINRKRLHPEDQRMAELLYPHLARAYANASQLDGALARLSDLRNPRDEIVPHPTKLKSLGLTPREAEVLHWVIQGKRDAEIALILSNSRRTIEKHVQSILRKFGVETRTAAVLVATERLRKKEFFIAGRYQRSTASREHHEG
jgi:DNA-binding CsgD family transcriptional regulator